MGVTLELLGGAPISEFYKHTGPCRWSHRWKYWIALLVLQIRNYSNTELLKVVSKKILKKRMWAKKMRNSSDIGIFKNYHGSLTWEGVWYFWLLDYETIKNKTPETVFQSLYPMLFHCFTAKIYISPQLTSSLPKVLWTLTKAKFFELFPLPLAVWFSWNIYPELKWGWRGWISHQWGG